MSWSETLISVTKPNQQKTIRMFSFKKHNDYITFIVQKWLLFHLQCFDRSKCYIASNHSSGFVIIMSCGLLIWNERQYIYSSKQDNKYKIPMQNKLVWSRLLSQPLYIYIYVKMQPNFISIAEITMHFSIHKNWCTWTACLQESNCKHDYSRCLVQISVRIHLQCFHWECLPLPATIHLAWRAKKTFTSSV